MTAPVNVEKCVQYLRRIGVDISPDLAASWLHQQATDRAKRRAHNRELKRSCGHFATHDCTVYTTDGAWVDRVCSDCRRVVSRRPVRPPPPRRRKSHPKCAVA